ncbi:MAG: hypothetical protein NZM12_02880 [Steroidobacteraceae bacterium]|nr:hypothetical protein [Steroidobacteraceae bacterium]MDW8258706.1 hypothetical protein [Gammaproteobacteria bacterium]
MIQLETSQIETVAGGFCPEWPLVRPAQDHHWLMQALGKQCDDALWVTTDPPDIGLPD